MLTDPFSVATALLEQMDWSGPALAIGASVIVITNWSVTAMQPPLLVDVKVSVTEPAAVSAALGV
jgi:hypothetical protein